MEEFLILKDIAIIFGLSVIVLWICNRIRIPAVVGFLVTGVISGPFGLGLVHNVTNVDTLAEVGIMLLLFIIGLELSLTRLRDIKKYFIIGGLLQVGLTVALGAAAAIIIGRPTGESFFLGFLLAMSSTAIVLKVLETQDQLDSPHGRLCLGILIFQDIVAVPMMLVTPLLGTATLEFDAILISEIALGLGAVALVFVAAVKIVPPLLHQVARARSRELFSLSVLTLCFSVACLAHGIGLSLAIGAFLAGLIISKSEYRHEAVGNMLPLQDVFLSLFFVSIGMLLNVHFFFEHFFLIVSITALVILMKFLVVAFTGYCLGLTLRVMVLAGVSLAQIGEFSFVLSKAGSMAGLGTPFLYQLFLAVALLTMVATPNMIGCSQFLLRLIQRLPLPEKWRTGLLVPEAAKKEEYKDHILIVGFGLAGRTLAKLARQTAVQYNILEMNPDTVRKEHANGEPIHFGDATHESMLHHMHVHTAKTVAIMINDVQATRRIVQTVRSMNPDVFIIVRTRYMQEVEIMLQLGANDVIPDEFGASLEMSVRVLKHCDIQESQIDNLVSAVRRENSNSSLRTDKTFKHAAIFGES